MLDTPVKRSVSGATALPLPGNEPGQPLWQRVAFATVVLGLGITAIAVGAASITYRVTHLTVENGMINARMVRLRAPINGKIKAFYGQSGAPVRTGQLIARVAPAPQEEQSLLQLQGDVNTSTTQLLASRQSLAFLRQQLSNLENQDQALQQANVAIADKEVSHQRAAVDAAVAKATAARLDFERYSKLLAEGAVSRQKVDQLQALWKSAEAEVEQAKATLYSAKTSLNAFEDGIALRPGATLADQRLSLMQTIQSQTAVVTTLETALLSKKQRLTQAQAIYSKRKDVEVPAPFTGVIYRTEREQGEQVNRPDTLLTLLDCNDLWVETLVSADQASRIDSDKPVRVKLAGETRTFVGKVELIEAISSLEALKQQVQAVFPSMSPHLTGQPLARVTVRIPPASQQSQAHQFCGLGQSASVTFGMKFLGG